MYITMSHNGDSVSDDYIIGRDNKKVYFSVIIGNQDVTLNLSPREAFEIADTLMECAGDIAFKRQNNEMP